MSRGLSDQQRRILGLGRAINKAVNGSLILIEGRRDDSKQRWPLPALYGHGLAEITARYVMHLLHGVPIAPRGTVPGFFVGTPQVKSLKASTMRAIRSLMDRGHVIYRPAWSQWPNTEWPGEYRAQVAFCESLAPPQAYSKQWAYALTPTGAELGAEHEPDLDPDRIIEALAALMHDPDAYYSQPAARALRARREALLWAA